MAGYSSKKPSLTQKEVAYQIFLRTGLPADMIKTTLDIYGEIVQEGLLGQVEIPIPGIGHFSWKQINPRSNVRRWNPQEHCYTEPQDIQGFQKTVLRLSSKWSAKQKAATLFDIGEENPANTNLVSYDENDEIDNENDKIDGEDADDDSSE